jgi:hypothetical protein
MVDHDDEIDVGDNDEIDDADDARLSVDPVAAALALRDLVAEFSKAYNLVTTDKAKAARLRAVDKLDKRAADAVTVRDEARAEAAEIVAKIERDTNALAERERALDARKAAFASSLEDARCELYAHHNRIEQAHRQLVHRVMATAGITGNWNFDLQDPPTWQQLRRMIADLPDDLPAPAAEVVSENVRHDWAGSEFIANTTLTRSVRGAV